MTALWPPSLRDEACKEVYQYIDQNIRSLPRKPDGSFDSAKPDFHRNDVDAMRHAYVSGVFTQEYGETVADIFGRANELIAYGSRSRGSDADINMDLWNNAVGRRYGTKTRDRNKLLEILLEALQKGEFITNISDSRQYEGSSNYEPDERTRVVVLKEGPTGRNEMFFDLVTKLGLTREDFVAAINRGDYPKFQVSIINGVATPVSKRDESDQNNLG